MALTVPGRDSNPHAMLPRLLCLLALFTTLPAADLAIIPAMQRLDLRADEVRMVAFAISAPRQTTITAVIADCACIRVMSTLPVAVGDSGRADIHLRVTGLRPGMEDILVATSAGILRAQVQIVGPGAGRGLDQLRAAVTAAATAHRSILAIAHDLHGQVRHCGCSQGSLGGIGRLAGLPALVAAMQPAVAATWVLSGDADGARPGVGAALAERGWRLGDARVRVTADPLPALAAPGVVAVIPTTTVAAEHRRLVRPILTEGMAVELLLVDAAGAVQGRHTVPIDDSLPDDAALPERFRDRLSVAIDPDASPSTACAGCHSSAFAAWQRSRHARALESLPAADRTDACIGCHVSSVAVATVAPGVSCQSCHLGSEAHRLSGGTSRTTGTVDCRGCHDARHHPAFQRELAWPLVQHGR